MVGLGVKKQDGVKCEEIDWEGDVLEIKPEEDQDVGRTKLRLVETSRRGWQGPRTGTIGKLDGATTKKLSISQHTPKTRK